MSKPTIRAIIFDMDGVISDTAELHYRAWQRVADEENIPFSHEKYRRMSGTARTENLRIFTEDLALNERTKQNLMDRKQAYFAEVRDKLQPSDAMAGIRELIAEAKKRGLQVGIGSASHNAKQVLERLQLTHHFDVIGDAYTVKNSKPAPDIFLWVAGGLNVLPSECLVLEDAQAGVDAARTGGFYVIAINKFPLENAHAQIQSTANISLKELLNLIN